MRTRYWALRVLLLPLLVLLTSCDRESVNASSGATAGSASTSAEGMCDKHGVPEALCTKCNPALATVFKAKGDWCNQHDFPKSFCPVCKPNGTFPDVGSAPASHDWCGGHGLPESKCTKCNPALVSKFKATGDWCEEHGFPESVCPVCNPQSAPGGSAAAADWCVEHRVPESKCTKCNTGLVAKYKKTGDWCAEHGFPESVCPICHPQPIPAGAPGSGSFAPGTKIKFRSAEIEKSAGIQTASARRASMGAGVSCTARIDYNRNKLADIRALVPGVVRKLRVDLGQKVEKGTPLFVLESTRVGELQASMSGLKQRVSTARSNHTRQAALVADGLVAKRNLELAKQELASARADVASSRAAIRLAGRPGGGVGRFVLSSPLAGTVVRRPAVVGAYATADTSLGIVANTSTMWAIFDVPEASAQNVAVGQSVSIVVDGGHETHRAEITWVASEVDPKTRLVAARAEIDNKAGKVRANQFARAVIETNSAANGSVMVPRDALQRFGKKTLVFVRLSAGVYEPRTVVAGPGDTQEVQVTGDVRPGESVVTTGAYLLKTELSPESIGAGCCDVEAPEAK